MERILARSRTIYIAKCMDIRRGEEFGEIIHSTAVSAEKRSLLSTDAIPYNSLVLYDIRSVSCSQVAQVVKNLCVNAGDVGSIPGSGRFPGGGNGNAHKYSCLENSMDRGA